jgi:hypothetical protein
MENGLTLATNILDFIKKTFKNKKKSFPKLLTLTKINDIISYKVKQDKQNKLLKGWDYLWQRR